MKDLTALSLLPPPSKVGLPVAAGKAFSDIAAAGQLTRVSPLRLLSRLTAANAQGHLLLENEDGQLGFVLKNGKLEAVHSSWPTDSRERWLLAAGLLTPMELGRPDFHIEEWLASRLASGHMGEAQLLQCLRSVAWQVLSRAFLWTEGSYVWQASLPQTPTPLSMDNGELFLSALRTLPEPWLQKRLQPHWETPWHAGPNVAFAENLPWEEAEYEALRHLQLCDIPAKALPPYDIKAPYARVAFMLWQAEIWLPQEVWAQKLPSPPGANPSALTPPSPELLSAALTVAQPTPPPAEAPPPRAYPPKPWALPSADRLFPHVRTPAPPRASGPPKASPPPPGAALPSADSLFPYVRTPAPPRASGPPKASPLPPSSPLLSAALTVAPPTPPPAEAPSPRAYPPYRWALPSADSLFPPQSGMEATQQPPASAAGFRPPGGHPSAAPPRAAEAKGPRFRQTPPSEPQPPPRARGGSSAHPPSDNPFAAFEKSKGGEGHSPPSDNPFAAFEKSKGGEGHSPPPDKPFAAFEKSKGGEGHSPPPDKPFAVFEKSKGGEGHSPPPDNPFAAFEKSKGGEGHSPPPDKPFAVFEKSKGGEGHSPPPDNPFAAFEKSKGGEGHSPPPDKPFAVFEKGPGTSPGTEGFPLAPTPVNLGVSLAPSPREVEGVSPSPGVSPAPHAANPVSLTAIPTPPAANPTPPPAGPPGNLLAPTPLQTPAPPAAEAAQEARLRAQKEAWEKEDAFSILGVAREAEGPAIKRAYFELVRRFHPDKLPPEASEEAKRLAAEVFSQLGAAYRCLMDEEERKALLLKLAGAKPVGLEALFAAEDLFRRAARMVSSRRFAEALPLLQEATQLNPAAAEFWAYLGYAKRFIPWYGEKAALMDLEKAKRQNPGFADTYYFLGHLAKLRGEVALARKLFGQCLALEAGHMEAQRELRLLRGA